MFYYKISGIYWNEVSFISAYRRSSAGYIQKIKEHSRWSFFNEPWYDAYPKECNVHLWISYCIGEFHTRHEPVTVKSTKITLLVFCVRDRIDCGSMVMSGCWKNIFECFSLGCAQNVFTTWSEEFIDSWNELFSFSILTLDVIVTLSFSIYLSIFAFTERS